MPTCVYRNYHKLLSEAPNPDSLLLDRNDTVAAAILQQISEHHHESIEVHPNLNEKIPQSVTYGPPTPALGWMYGEKGEKLVAFTTDPIVNHTLVALLRHEMTEWWQNNPSTSRYTYPGNHEVHLSDLCKHNSTIQHHVEELLNNVVYPLVRAHFDLADARQLCLYDSLLIRYNASLSTSPQGAGLPLHRDLGLVSVNIMLNNEYQGGGTFFEALLSHPQPIQNPRGVGNAMLHDSWQRHGGAGTTAGVRDIWVLFVTTRQTHPQDVSTRLKIQARLAEAEEREQLLKLALQMMPTDGEAWHHLGLTLRRKTPDMALQCLRRAILHTPNDATLYNNLGLVLEQWHSTDSNASLVAFERSLELHRKCLEFGCYVQEEFDSTAWNYAVVLAERKLWIQVLQVLDLISHQGRHWLEAKDLKEYCQGQVPCETT
jgi:tetratricopeptide (TPR) repeat protein